MDKRNPKQTCALCAYFKFNEFGDPCCYFPLIPTEEPDGFNISKDDSCREWTYYGTKIEPEPFRDFAFVDGYLTGLSHRLRRLEGRVEGLEQVITELVTAIGMKKD